MTPGFADSSDMNHSCNHQAGSRYSQCFGSLLSTDVITGQKDQVLFLLVLVSGEGRGGEGRGGEGGRG